MKEVKPKYSGKKMKSKDRKLLARHRCGNEMRTKDYWKDEEERVYRLCEREVEDMWHVLRECRETMRVEGIEEVLEEGEKGLLILKEIEKARNNQIYV